MIYPPHPQLWSLSQDSSQHSHHKKIQVSRQWHHTTTSIIIIITIMSQATRNRTAAMRRPRGWDRMGGCSRAMMDSHLTHTNPFTLLATSVTKLLRLTTVTSLRELYRRYWWSCWHNGTRKTALMLALCRFLRFKYSLAVTNDIFTKEDGDFLVKNGALAEERIKAIETGGCSYVAIREDISINLGPLEELSNLFKADLLLCESDGG